jgi:hypothetical protein
MMSEDTHSEMNLDQQIKLFEDSINRIEECRRIGTGDLSQLDIDLENAYRQVALLKIRKMMFSA